MSETQSDGFVRGSNHDGVREALLTAAVETVQRAGTSVVSIDDIAGVAGVGVREASTIFPVVDELLVAAALRMCASDLHLATVAVPSVSAYARHFAGRRDFYRAMRVGAVAQMLDARMAKLMAPLIAEQISALVGVRLTAEAFEALTAEVTAEAFEVTNGWILGSDDSASAESLYVELEAIVVRRFDDVRRFRGGERPAED